MAFCPACGNAIKTNGRSQETLKVSANVPKEVQDVAYNSSVKKPYEKWTDEEKISFIKRLDSEETKRFFHKGRKSIIGGIISAVLVCLLVLFVFNGAKEGIIYSMHLVDDYNYTFVMMKFLKFYDVLKWISVVLVIITTILEFFHAFRCFRKGVAKASAGWLSYRQYKKLKKSGELNRLRQMASEQE